MMMILMRIMIFNRKPSFFVLFSLFSKLKFESRISIFLRCCLFLRYCFFLADSRLISDWFSTNKQTNTLYWWWWWYLMVKFVKSFTRFDLVFLLHNHHHHHHWSSVIRRYVLLFVWFDFQGCLKFHCHYLHLFFSVNLHFLATIPLLSIWFFIQNILLRMNFCFLFLFCFNAIIIELTCCCSILRFPFTKFFFQFFHQFFYWVSFFREYWPEIFQKISLDYRISKKPSVSRQQKKTKIFCW